ncbi:hypothetical protein BC332_28147 [Capsicum chinense]|nr:hypothetical protein BC332_28147 [Capsicum chinense]
MLLTYISYSGLLKNTERTVWSSLEAYTDKMSKVTGDLNDTPFDVEHIEDIAQQVSETYEEFLSYSGLLKNTEQTVWSSLEAYINKMSKVTGDLNETLFDVEYVEDIAQQIPSSNLDAEYLRKRYATLLWNYGVKKTKKIYSSDHGDPPRPRPFYVPPTDKSNILAIE